MVQTIFFVVVATLSSCNSFLVAKHCVSKHARLTPHHAVTDDRLADCVTDLFLDAPEEVRTPKKLSTQGAGIPKWLKGTLYRNGPGMFGAQRTAKSAHKDAKIRRYNHVFDGLAKITRYHFGDDNSVTYSSRFIDSNFYKALKMGDMPAAAYAGEVIPAFTDTEKIVGMVGTAFDNTPVNVHQMGGPTGPLVALTDVSLMMEFDPVTLETKGMIKSPDPIVSFGGIETFSTAHPHFQNGYSYNVFMELRPVPLPFSTKSNVVHVVRSSDDLTRKSIGHFNTASSEVMPYIHDFSVSEKYAVVCAWPVHWGFSDILKDNGMMRNMKWAGDTENTKVYIFDIKNPSSDGAPAAVFEAPPMFAYHFINAYEEPSSAGNGRFDIVVDFTGYDTLDILKGDNAYALLSNIMDPELRKLQARDGRQYRLRLPMPPKGRRAPSAPVFVKHSILVAKDKTGREFTYEMPRVSPKQKTFKHRYSYGVTGFAQSEKGYDYWALVKLDHEVAEQNNIRSENAVTSLTWSSPHCFPSEAIFVANPTENKEDNGVLLSQVYDGAKKETFLLVLDAQDMSELGRYYTGTRCPVSFHGAFVPSK